MPELDAHALELLRQRSGLSIDLEGRLCHLGQPITHARTLEVLWGSLARQPDGRYLVTVGRESGYVRLADAPFGVRGVTRDGERLLVHLGDGSVEPVDLGLALEEDPPGAGRFVLRLAGRTFPITSE